MLPLQQAPVPQDGTADRWQAGVQQLHVRASPEETEGEGGMSRPYWDHQFGESAWETRERWRATLARRKAEGKCWQCAKLIADCRCPNVAHAIADQSGEAGETEGLDPKDASGGAPLGAIAPTPDLPGE
jgi:hypothetical protein